MLFSPRYYLSLIIFFIFIKDLNEFYLISAVVKGGIMKDIKKALKIAQKTLKPKPQKPKLTPEQFKQLTKVNMTLNMVLQGKLTLKDLSDDTQDMLLKLAKTFIEEAAKKATKKIDP